MRHLQFRLLSLSLRQCQGCYARMNGLALMTAELRRAYARRMRRKRPQHLPLASALFAVACSGTGTPKPDASVEVARPDLAADAPKEVGRSDLVADAPRDVESDADRPSNCVDLAWKGTRISGAVGFWQRRLYAFSTAGTDLTEASISIDDGSSSITKRSMSPTLTGLGTHDGRFLAGARDGEAFTVITGDLGDPRVSQSSFAIPEGMGVTPNVDFVAWDGEAFNMELGSSGFYTWALRLNPDGSVKQPLSKYGMLVDASYEGYDLGYKISTSAKSGVTYLFAATYQRQITGHTRDGTLLSWIPAGGVLTLPLFLGPPYYDMGIISSGGATSPTVSADDQGGAWIAWWQETNRLHNLLGVQHIAADGVLGTPLWFDEYASMAHTLLARTSESALLVMSSGHALYTFEVNGGKLSAARPLTEKQPAGSSNTVMYREMQIVSDGGTDWLVMDQPTEWSMTVRILKIAPGCVYPTYPAEALTP
jgi:hypothetical protein